jgi:hypothetical protein
VSSYFEDGVVWRIEERRKKKEEGELGRYTEKLAPRCANFYANCKMGISTCLYISLGKGHRRALRKEWIFQRTETSKL